MPVIRQVILQGLLILLIGACNTGNTGDGTSTPAALSAVTPEVGERPGMASVANLSVFDRSNLGNAADVEVQFDVPQSGSQVQERRVMLVKAGRASEFEVETAGNLTPERYAVPAQAGPSVRFRLPAELVDVDGEAIVEDKAYVAYVLSVADDSAVLSGPSAEITMANLATTWTLVTELPSATGGLAVDREGNIYAANIGLAPARTGSEIYRITPEGEYQLWVEGLGLSGASGNTFDAEGNLLQSSLRANTIHRITPGGTVTEFTRDGINSPVGIAAAADGSIYVANCGSNSIQRVTPAGKSERFAAGPLLACPNGITLDEAGNLYVANFFNGNVIKIKSNGEAALFVEVPGHNNGHILYHDSLLYVVSRGGHQVFTLTLEGDLALLAGTGERGHIDGLATEASFSLPNDIVVRPDGRRLYVNEALPTSGSANSPSVIRVIELARVD
jgi:DNA-binding beta-propeller fold protein YncE